MRFHFPKVILGLVVGLAVGPLHAELPPEAQAALDRGVMAAKEQEWLTAIQSFEQARHTAPAAPVVFFNLGLAESKIPGRELRAIAWFGAYLTAVPNAPNLVAVKDKIAALQITNDGNISRMIMSMEEVCHQPAVNHTSFSKDMNLHAVVKLWVEVGENILALKTVNLIEQMFWKDESWAYIAKAQAAAGDMAGALTTADLTQTTKKGAYLLDYKSSTREAIAGLQAKRGDMDGALKTTELIQDPGHKSGGLSSIAVAQARNGDMTGAENTIARIQDTEWKDFTRKAVAETGAKADPSGPPSIPVLSVTDIPPPHPASITVSDWIQKLDDAGENDRCSLKTAPFLDLAGYLKSLPPADGAQSVFESLQAATVKTVTARYVITQMLKLLPTHIRSVDEPPDTTNMERPKETIPPPPEKRYPQNGNPAPSAKPKLSGRGSWTGSVTLDFDAIIGPGCVDATVYLDGFGVTVTQQSPGTTVSVGAAGQCFHDDVVVSSLPNALYVANNQPVSFTLNFDRPLSNVTFTRARLNAGSSGVNTVGWNATAYSAANAAGTKLTQVGEEAKTAYRPDVIPAASFTLSGKGIRSVLFVRSTPLGNNISFGVSFAVLDDFVLTE